MADQKQHGAPQQDKGRRDPREGGDNSGKRYEGFEGMNYEQPRQPFGARNVGNKRPGNNNTSQRRRNEP